jgi:hypothetical protein
VRTVTPGPNVFCTRGSALLQRFTSALTSEVIVYDGVETEQREATTSTTGAEHKQERMQPAPEGQRAQSTETGKIEHRETADSKLGCGNRAARVNFVPQAQHSTNIVTEIPKLQQSELTLDEIGVKFDNSVQEATERLYSPSVNDNRDVCTLILLLASLISRLLLFVLQQTPIQKRRRKAADYFRDVIVPEAVVGVYT